MFVVNLNELHGAFEFDSVPFYGVYSVKLFPHNHVLTPNSDQEVYMGGSGLTGKTSFCFLKAFLNLRLPFICLLMRQVNKAQDWLLKPFTQYFDLS